MTAYTFAKATPSPRTQTHNHAGGLLTINSNQRGVILQFIPQGGTIKSALQTEEGCNPLNRGSCQLGPGDIEMSVGDHAFGGDNADIIVDIV